MRLDLTFVELHTPLFLADTNHGLKLHSDPKKNLKGQVEMYYDTDLRHTVITYKGHVAIVETTASKTLKDPSQIGVELGNPKPTPPKIDYVIDETITMARNMATIALSAQVSTPTSKPPKKPGKPAKFQGEESPGE